MQKQPRTRHVSGMKWRHSLFLSKTSLLLLLLLLLWSAFLWSGLSSFGSLISLSTLTTGLKAPTTSMNGANRWVGDKKITPPSFDFSLASSQAINVSPLFADYYHKNNGTQTLGNAMTAAFQANAGWLQFFTSGALLLPTSQPDATEQSNTARDPLLGLIADGVKDPGTGIVRLALLDSLLTAGSQVPIGGPGSPLTYVDLRKATSPDLLLPSSSDNHGVFIAGGTRADKDVGHVIAQPFWNYINRADISPGGWKTNFGAPLTEALPFTTTINGRTHHMVVQVFWHDGLILDQSTLNASGQPLIQRLDTSIAYLRTFGPPPVTVKARQTIWTQDDTALFNTIATWTEKSFAVADVAQYFPLVLLGDTTWYRGTLWYHVQWNVSGRIKYGWVAADAVTFTSPGNVAASAWMDTLSPELAAYLADLGNNVDAVVYDVTHQQYYTYNPSTHFIMGSSMKVAIMLTFFDMIEQQDREPTDDEMNLLTTMIENSNNDSASTLYYGEIGSAAGVASYLQRIHISDLHPNPNAWGYSTVTPMAMVNLLTLLYEGKILTAHHRALAFFWMEHIESDQQVGVGDTAPDGATVAMKDGWLPGPDDLWAMNSSGIVMQGQQTYIISVYTQGQPALVNGQAIVRRFCSAVASLLLP